MLTFLIAAVWIANGLFCKMLGLVPRHEQIVARILSNQYSHQLTLLIGLSEIVMAVWVLTNTRSTLNAITQIIIIAAMNTIEFMMAPDLLLWGRFNALFAFLFILLIYYNEFHLKKEKPRTI